ncbi:MAG: LON peptidase substrate-binding domain-containing protein [Rhodothermaceae bacterium]
MESVVPILPIKLVMLPGSVYPIHITDEKYKRMISHCVNNKADFGIVAEIDSEINNVGCLVGIKEVNSAQGDDSLDIVVIGQDRFYTVNTKPHFDGYLEAEIESYLDHPNTDETTPLFIDALDTLKDILNKTNLKLDENYWKNLTTAPIKSYKLAEKSGLSLQQRQELLVLKDEPKRLQYIYDHLKKVSSFIDQDKVVKKLIASDGYLN